MTGTLRAAFIALVLLLGTVGLPGCDLSAPATPPAAESYAPIPLPSPVLAGQTSLEEALARRRSVREFEDTPLTRPELGQLLWAAQGISHERGFRTAPSAGALYPLELYVATAEGVFHYVPKAHELEVVSREDARKPLHEAALRQDAVRQAPAVIVVTAIYARTATKYGAERSPRYVHLEAGHAAQNLLLEAVTLELGAVPIGAFDDKGVQEALGVPADHEPLYVIPVGHPHE